MRARDVMSRPVYSVRPDTPIEQAAALLDNWWAPEFLKQVYDRFGFKETDDPVLLPQTLGSSGLPSWLRLPAGLQLGRPARVALAGLALMAATAGGTYGLLSAAYDAAPAANFEAAPGVPQHKKHHAKPHRSPERS